MLKLLAWEYHWKVWYWTHVGWWGVFLPILLYIAVYAPLVWAALGRRKP